MELKLYFLTGLHPGQTFFLPFLRRAFNTLRPPTVAILLLNPETRALLRLVPNKVAPSPFFLFPCTTRRPRPAPEKALLTGSSTSPATHGLHQLNHPTSSFPFIRNIKCTFRISCYLQIKPYQQKSRRALSALLRRSQTRIAD